MLPDDILLEIIYVMPIESMGLIPVTVWYDNGTDWRTYTEGSVKSQRCRIFLGVRDGLIDAYKRVFACMLNRKDAKASPYARYHLVVSTLGQYFLPWSDGLRQRCV